MAKRIDRIISEGIESKYFQRCIHVEYVDIAGRS